MISRIKAFFRDAGAKESAGASHSRDEKQLAAATLMAVAATMDGALDEAERKVIHEVAMRRFSLSAAEADDLIEEATTASAESTQLLRFTSAVKQHFDHDERIEVIEMLWEVVYADGVLHDYEANLLRRVAGLIYVTDRERGDARKRAMARLGIDESPGADDASA